MQLSAQVFAPSIKKFASISLFEIREEYLLKWKIKFMDWFSPMLFLASIL